MIADNRGRVLWYHQLANPVEATDFRAQTYRGKPVLTWWEGTMSKAGVGRGSLRRLRRPSYRKSPPCKAGNGLDGDLHEFQLTPRGTAFITDLPRGAGRPQLGRWAEGRLRLRQRRPGDRRRHRPASCSSGTASATCRSPIDAGEPRARAARNEEAAARLLPRQLGRRRAGREDPDLGRNTSAIYLLARDGRIVWRLGGKRATSARRLPSSSRYQHNARLHRDTLTLFDNGAIPKVEPFTRPLVLQLDPATKRARIVKTFVHPQKFASPFEGNLAAPRRTAARSSAGAASAR